MHLAADLVVAFVALLHTWFLVLEMFLWDKPLGRKVFNTTPEFAVASKKLAMNQGLYNGFLVAGLVWGLALVAFGLFSKVVLADSIFAPVAEQVFATAASVSATDAWAGVLGFSGQIYFDFSGYSLCAIGLALCFGFEFPDNFRYPYAARGFSDFWRRWHITLSTWLRDYLYIPLGGSAEGRAKTYRNLMLTMLLGGLWHGASWMFVAWGGLHGAYLAIERALRGPRARGSTPTSGGVALPLATFLVVTLTWIPFRAPEGIRMVRIDRITGKPVYGVWPSNDPKPAVIWEAFKPESEPRRAVAQGDQVADKPKDVKPAQQQEAPRDSDFLQREGGIY